MRWNDCYNHACTIVTISLHAPVWLLQSVRCGCMIVTISSRVTCAFTIIWKNRLKSSGVYFLESAKTLVLLHTRRTFTAPIYYDRTKLSCANFSQSLWSKFSRQRILPAPIYYNLTKLSCANFSQSTKTLVLLHTRRTLIIASKKVGIPSPESDIPSINQNDKIDETKTFIPKPKSIHPSLSDAYVDSLSKT